MAGAELRESRDKELDRTSVCDSTLRNYDNCLCRTNMGEIPKNKNERNGRLAHCGYNGSYFGERNTSQAKVI